MAQKPLAPDEESVLVAFRLVETMHDEIEQHVASKRVSSKSELLREAVRRYLADEGVAATG